MAQREKAMKYGELTLGQVEAIVNKLGGMDGVQRFLRGELVIKPTECTFKTWKTIKLGTGLKTADDFRKALKKADCNISDWANDIIGKSAFSVSPEEVDAELVVVSVAELGFKNGATCADIYKRAEELGLALCPNEVGPQLRLQYKDQPNGGGFASEWNPYRFGWQPQRVQRGTPRWWCAVAVQPLRQP